MALFSGLGSGTIGDPYQITTKEELLELKGYGVPETGTFSGTGVDDVTFKSTGYKGTPSDTYTITIKESGEYKILDFHVSTQGSGYEVGDILTVDGGDPSNLATVRITDNTTNACEIVNSGKGYNTSGNHTTTATTGSGSGLIIYITSYSLDLVTTSKNGESLYDIQLNNYDTFPKEITITDNVVARMGTIDGHTANDSWTVYPKPDAYFKLMNNIDMGGLDDVSSTLDLENFYARFDGNNKEITGVCLGISYYNTGFDIRNGSYVKNVTLRPTIARGTNGYQQDQTFFGTTKRTLSQVSLENIKVITGGDTVSLRYFSPHNFDSSCSLSNIVIEGNILQVFSGDVSCLIENVKVLRLWDGNDNSFYHDRLAIVYRLTSTGVMKKCQVTNLNLNLKKISGLLVKTLDDGGKIIQSFVQGDINITYDSENSNYRSNVLVGLATFNSNSTAQIVDCYFKGNFNIGLADGLSVDGEYGDYSGYVMSTSNTHIIERCVVNGDINTPMYDNRSIIAPSAGGTNINNNFYNSDAIVSITPLEVTGKQTGLTNEEFSQESSYTTFDFVDVWEMVNGEPVLRDNPVYNYETDIATCGIKSITRLSSTSVRVELDPVFTNSYGFDVLLNDTIVQTFENTLSTVVNLTEEDNNYVIKSFIINSESTKIYSIVNDYDHYIENGAVLTPTTIDIEERVELDEINNPSINVHGSIMYNGYVYGSTRGSAGYPHHGVITKTPLNNISATVNYVIKPSTQPDSYYDGLADSFAKNLAYASGMEQIVEVGGYLYTVAQSDQVTGYILVQFDPINNTSKKFRISSNDITSRAPLLADDTYLYFVSQRYIKKVLASQFVGDQFSEFNTDADFPLVTEGIYDMQSEGGYIEGGYNAVDTGIVHSIVMDSEYIYAAYTTSDISAGDTDSSGYLSSLGVSTYEVRKVKISDMSPAGWKKIPKSTDDCTQTDTHLFYGIEVLPNANVNTYGYGWGAYAVRKSDLNVTGLPKLHQTDESPVYGSYASLIFGDYLIDCKTNKYVYVIDITDVDNWSVNEPVGKRTLKVYDFEYENTPITNPINELLRNEDGKFYAFTWGDNTLNQLELTGMDFFSVPTVNTISSVVDNNSVVLTGFILNTGGKSITEKGFKYGTSPDNLINTVINNDETSEFQSSIYDLKYGTTYYYQSYAINSEGESTSNILSFTIEANMFLGTIPISRMFLGDIELFLP